MAKNFTTGSFIARWGFAAVLVLGTYNPSGYSYIGWLMSKDVTFGPVLAIVGLVLLIAWIIYLRATFLSMGWLGVSLGAALFAAIIWLLVDIGWLHLGFNRNYCLLSATTIVYHIGDRNVLVAYSQTPDRSGRRG